MHRIPAAIVTILCLTAKTHAAEPHPQITIFAAASLTDALTEATDAFTKASGIDARVSFAASSALARQIEAGAKADVFISADTKWMDYLQSRQLIDTTSRRDAVANRLVLIAPIKSRIDLTIGPHFPLGASLGRNRLAIADPDSVPAGRYARSALTALGVWSEVANRVVRADNVRVALAYVARDEAALGIVYATDALIEKRVRVVDTFPESTHAPIVYPLALTRTASPIAKTFSAFIFSFDAANIFKKYGFSTNR